MNSTDTVRIRPKACGGGTYRPATRTGAAISLAAGLLLQSSATVAESIRDRNRSDQVAGIDSRETLGEGIDLLADGRPLNEMGIVPKVAFTGTAESFQGERDDLLSAALQRLKDAPLPQAPDSEELGVPPGVEQPVL